MEGHLNKSQIEKALSDADEAVPGSSERAPTRPVEINRVENLTLGDFNPQPPPYVVNGLTAVEPRYAFAPEDRAVLEWFEYHAPNQDQVDRITHIREAAKSLAQIILSNAPPSAERTLALRSLHLTTMQANASIVLH